MCSSYGCMDCIASVGASAVAIAVPLRLFGRRIIDTTCEASPKACQALRATFKIAYGGLVVALAIALLRALLCTAG